MNKRQLIVAWVTGIIICIVCLHPPTYEYDERLRADLIKTILYIIPLMIIGILLIFTLRSDEVVKKIKQTTLKLREILRKNFSVINKWIGRFVVLSIGISVLLFILQSIFGNMPEFSGNIVICSIFLTFFYLLYLCVRLFIWVKNNRNYAWRNSLRIVKGELVILGGIIGLGISIGLVSMMLPIAHHKTKLHYIYEDFDVLSDGELTELKEDFNKIEDYCALHPEIKIYGYHTGDPKIDWVISGDKLSILDIASKMAQENPENQGLYNSLKAMSDKISQGGKSFDTLSSVTVDDTRTPLEKAKDSILHYIKRLSTSEGISSLGRFIVFLGYPIILGLRLLFGLLKNRERVTVAIRNNF